MSIKKMAFSLVEILITLVIIGLVATMTLPNLMQKQRENITIKKLEKTYSLLQQSFQLSVEEFGYPSDWGLSRDIQNAKLNAIPTNAIIIRDRILLLAKKIYICNDPKDQSKCRYELNKNNLKNGGSLNCSALLIDGISISVMANGKAESVRGSGVLKKTYAIVSVNIKQHLGSNLPVNGLTSFNFYLTDVGLIPQGTPEETAYPFPDFGVVKGTFNSPGYTAWVLKNKNMDYLHCPKKLSWSGKHSCGE